MKHTLLIVVGLVFLCSSIVAQNTVIGTVTDDTGAPIPGVNIIEKDSNNGAVSDFDGNYSIEVGENAVLTFSYVGFAVQEIPVAGQNQINVSLAKSDQELDEVVVIGYGNVSRKEITSSISTVKGEEINKIVASNAAEALQGRATGVQIVSAGGGPGASPRILIRGVISNNGSNPLIVVDGILLPDDTSLNFLNPADIETVQILKDASALAIYGTRASNGAVLITTKRGKAGITTINADISYGVQSLSKIEMAGANEYIEVMNQRRANDNQAPYEVPDTFVDTDWWDETIENFAPVTNVNVRASGGTEKIRYNGSISYFDNESNFTKGWYERVTGRFNIDFKITDKLSLQQDLNPRIEKFENTPLGAFFNILRIDPLTDVYLPQNERVDRNIFSIYDQSNNLVPNPVAGINRIFDETDFFAFFSNTKLDYQITPDVTVSSQFGLNVSSSRRDQFFPEFMISPTELREINEVRRRTTDQFDFVWNNTINFKKQINKHYINLLGGVLYDSQRFNFLQGNREDIPNNENPDLRYLDAATGEGFDLGGNESVKNFLSGIFRAIYNFDNRYYLTSSIRVDKSSIFNLDNNTGIFPGVSFAWDIDSEPFFKSNFISNLRLSVGTGQLGNSNVPVTSRFFEVGNGDFIFNQGRVSTNFLSRFGNPNLRWETVKDQNFGLTGAVLDNALSFTIEYYKKNSDGLLFQVELPNYTGIPGLVAQNIGSFESKGFDVQVGYTKAFGDFSVDFSVNVSTNESIAKDLAAGNEQLFGQKREDLGNRFIKITEEGKEIGLFYGFKTDGIFQNQTEVNSHSAEDGTILQPNAQPGDLRFVDINRDGAIDDEDLTTIGNPFPDFYGGITLNMQYKGFDLSSQWYGTYGNEVFNFANTFLYSGGQDVNVARGTLDKVWTPQNPTAEFPRLSILDRNGNYLRPSNLFVEDGSYLRLRNLQIGYTFKSEKLKSLRVFVSGQNLLTITDYSGLDPEVQSPDGASNNIITNLGVDYARYPVAKTYLVGLNITL